VPPEIFEALGPWGSLGLIVTLVGMVVTGFIKGWIFTSTSVQWQNKHLEARLKDKDEIIAEQRATIAAVLETNRTNSASIQELVEVSRTMNAVISALPRAGVDK
jgi:hypothetical protein